MFGSNKDASDLGRWGKTNCYADQAVIIKKFVPICEKDISKYLKSNKSMFAIMNLPENRAYHVIMKM